MKYSRSLVILVVGVLGLAVSRPSHAGQPSADTESPAALPAESRAEASDGSGKQPRIALLNVDYVFRNYRPLAEAKLEMKAEVDAAEAVLVARKQAIEGKRAQLAGLEVGSTAHTNLTKELVSDHAQMTADAEIQKQQFLRKEAGIYLSVYEEMDTVCQAYAKSHGIGMIMRFNDTPVNRNDPKDVLRWLNRPIVYHDGGLDITREIVEGMKARIATPADTVEPRPADETPKPIDEVETAPVSGLSQRP